ncbi:MAG: polysaccharide biosynthesis/export family protein [Kiritimatiellia bacterium]|jgi:polysaccharide export outer membrane protein|nr:polysaccharide biosynthesis/export family protein [Kiritimatiellia bacterium]MDP6847308.1 polysaccharide biosynthesis/export family protein [Kiritimatiellia bacterium]
MMFISEFAGRDVLNKWASLVCVTALLFLSSCATPTNRSEMGSPSSTDKAASKELAEKQLAEGRFVLGPGDQVAIKVWRNTDLDRTATVDPLGNLDLPLGGRIKADGLSPLQLRDEIVKALAKYIINPRVDVNVVSVKSQRFYVFGEAKTPGSFALDRRMLVWEAIASAGGFTEDANRRKVLVIRTSLEKPRVDTVDVLNIVKNGAVEGRPGIMSGDIVLIPPTKIASVERFMSRINTILRPVVTAEQGIILFPEVEDALSGETSSQRSSFTVGP